MKTIISDFPKKIIFKSTGEELKLSETVDDVKRISHSMRGKVKPVPAKPVVKQKTYRYTFLPSHKRVACNKILGNTVDFTLEYINRLIKFELIECQY